MNRSLFCIEWQQLRHIWITGGIKNVIILAMASVVGLIFLYFLSRSALALGSVVSPDVVGPVLSLVFFVALITICLFGIPQVFKQLYSATDLQLLFTLPIATRKIFFVKYVQTFFGLPGIVGIVMLVLLTAFGIGSGYGWSYYPVLFLTVAAITVMAVSLAFLINLGLVQILPAKRIKEMMTVLGILLMVLIYAGIQIPTLTGGLHLSPQNLTSWQGLPVWLPTTFAADGIGLAAQGKTMAWLPTLIIVLMAVFMAFLASSLVERGFRRGWIRMSEGEGKKVKSKKQSRQPLHHPVIFVGIKEWHSLRRDVREWMMLLPMLVFMLFPFVGNLLTGDASVLRERPLISWIVVQAGFSFLFGIFSGVLTSASVGREGKAAWIMRILPLSGRQVALGKFWISWLLPLVLICLLEVGFGILFLWPWPYILAGIALLGVLTLGINGMALWIGTLAPRYNPNNPQDRVQPGTRFLLMLMTFIYVAIAGFIGFFILFPAQYEPSLAQVAQEGSSFIHIAASILDTGIQFKAAHEIWGYALSIGALLIFSLGIAAVTLFLSAKRFDKGIQVDIVQASGGKGFLRPSPLSKNKL